MLAACRTNSLDGRECKFKWLLQITTVFWLNDEAAIIQSQGKVFPLRFFKNEYLLQVEILICNSSSEAIGFAWCIKVVKWDLQPSKPGLAQ